VPIAKPQQIADKIKNFSLKPLSIHLSNASRDAVEKKIRPKSTYTLMESFTMIGIERKKRTPKRA
jgi:hypothetical protein